MEIDYLRLIKKYMAIFIIFPLVTAIISLFFVYRQPSLYQSSAKIYVKDTGNLQIIYAAAKSKTILDSVIDKLNLVEVLKTENMDKARKTILNNLETIRDSRTNVFEIRFKSINKELSAEILNAIVAELEKSYPELRLKETENDPIDFKIIDKAGSLGAINFNKTGIIAMSIFLSILEAILLSLIIEFFSPRGLKKGQ